MRTISIWRQRRRDGERGQSLVEFALVLPVMILLLLATAPLQSAPPAVAQVQREIDATL